MDTIAAISTPSGISALGVIRLSGRESIPLLTRLFKGHKKVSSFEHHRAYVGKLIDGDTLLDDVVVIIFKAPSSYTGEDLVEISCHGGRIVLERVLKAFFKYGAKPAGPGEFTQRAFLNGKMDLLQAEAIEDIITAESELALLAAQSLLSGKLSEKINELKTQLIELISGFEAEIEFPEEDDVTDHVRQALESRYVLIQTIIDYLETLSDSFEQGMLMKEGFTVAIFGAPNTGKSTLLNQMIGFERALVSDQPGTTRDYIREKIMIHGLPVTLIDMAGIRTDAGQIEKEGMEQSKRLLKESSLALFILDGTRPVSADDQLALESCPEPIPKIWVINKIDCRMKLSIEDPLIKAKKPFLISALKGTGMRELVLAVNESLNKRSIPQKTELVLTHIRHKNSLVQARMFLSEAQKGIKTNQESEIVVYELKNALNELRILTGEVTVEDILSHIFSHFCIGK
ncbi:MAG: tRNA uridine-5-carboxymethylaminomethyl(34) synthesis GTPase MnmE [Candidatus Aureabacteria bacterium]|nr:tRNA uridine-5-carboxymethylaminomethyl(34) synthesis GTPase MnmE [Candidatus Auribacterota bacterium]